MTVGHGIGGDEFEAGRQADLAQTRADVVERDGHAVHQGGDDGEDAARIAVLVDAGERGLGQVLEERRALSERKRAVLLHRHRPVLAREESLRADLLDMIPHRGGHVGVGADGGAARTVDVSLLEADRLARVAEEGDVVDADRRDDGGVGVDRVDGVKTAAEPDLEDHDVELVLAEDPEDGERRVFEVGERHVAAGLLDRAEGVHEAFVVYFAPVDYAALVEADEVRRGVHAGRVARRAVDALEHRAGRALAVRAAHGNDGSGREVEPHALDHGLHAIESEVDGLRVQHFDVREPRVKGLGIKHERESPVWKMEKPSERCVLRSSRAARKCVRVGRAVRQAPATGGLRIRCCVRQEMRERISRRSTIMSIWPLASRNSARWKPSGSFCPMVCSMTLGPAKPIRAWGSARMISPSMAKLAVTPPVVGSVSTLINSCPAS